MADRKPVGGVDNAWRRIGSIDNLTTITGVLWFDEAISYDALSEPVEPEQPLLKSVAQLLVADGLVEPQHPGDGRQIVDGADATPGIVDAADRLSVGHQRPPPGGPAAVGRSPDSARSPWWDPARGMG